MQTPPEVAAVAVLIGCDIGKIDELSIRYSKIKSRLLEQPVQRAGSDSV